MGLTKVALEGLGKIPIVGPLLDTNEALDAARAKAKAGGNAISSMSAAMGSMAKSLVSSLIDPLVVIGLLVKGFQTFLELGFAVDKQVTDLSKSMAVSSGDFPWSFAISPKVFPMYKLFSESFAKPIIKTFSGDPAPSIRFSH